MNPPPAPPSVHPRPCVHRFSAAQAKRLLVIQFVRVFRYFALGSILSLLPLCLPEAVEKRSNLFLFLIVLNAVFVFFCGLSVWLFWRKRVRPLRGSTAVVRRSDGSALYVAPPDRVFGVGWKKGRVTAIRTVAQGGTDLALDAFEDLDGLLREIEQMFEIKDIADSDENAKDMVRILSRFRDSISANFGRGEFSTNCGSVKTRLSYYASSALRTSKTSESKSKRLWKMTRFPRWVVSL